MARLKIVNDRKDNVTVTTCTLDSWRQLNLIYDMYIEKTGFQLLAMKSYGFIATNGSEKIIVYIKGGKKECGN